MVFQRFRGGPIDFLPRVKRFVGQYPLGGLRIHGGQPLDVPFETFGQEFLGKDDILMDLAVFRLNRDVGKRHGIAEDADLAANLEGDAVADRRRRFEVENRAVFLRIDGIFRIFKDADRTALRVESNGQRIEFPLVDRQVEQGQDLPYSLARRFAVPVSIGGKRAAGKRAVGRVSLEAAVKRGDLRSRDRRPVRGQGECGRLIVTGHIPGLPTENRT